MSIRHHSNDHWDANVVGHRWIGRCHNNQRLKDISRHDTYWIFSHIFFCQRFCSLKRFDVTFVNGVMPFKMSNEGEINIAALREVQCTVKAYWFSSSGLIYPARKSCIVSNGFVLSCFVLMKRDAIFAWSSATAIIKNSWVNKYYGVCVSNYFCDISHTHTHTYMYIYIYVCVCYHIHIQ